MSRPFFYCSDLSRASGERSFGTASVGEVWLLVEYREAWGAHALQDSALSADVKRHLNNFCKIVPRARLLFIKQERVRPEAPVCFVVRCRESAPSIERLELAGYDDLLNLDFHALAAGAPLAGGVRLDTPLYLVCTHGKRDKCCAKFGYALYKSLREGEPDGHGDGGGVPVWQSSHVGGDRFAANLVCFPHGLFYAHVTPEAGRRIIAQYERRQLLLEGYRGRACYSYAVQAAEFFVRTETGLAALDGLRYRRHERTGDRSWRVTFIEETGARTAIETGIETGAGTGNETGVGTNTGTGAGHTIHEADIAARASDFHNYITCQSDEERPVVQYVLENYRAT
ncbi:MAG TPA: sucrase ferredoxin [Pyrinomonadaceae bacterium]|nr:sucrase ferredoxin [Pyrinomonadaceae bacterium]